MAKKTRIVVAENHTLTRKGYVSLLKDIDTIEVIGEAANGKELIKILEKAEVDIVLLDLEMPVMSGKEALKIIKTRFPKVKVVVVSFHSQEHVIVDLIKQGANAFVVKDNSYETFIETIETVHEQGYSYSKEVSRMLVGELSRKNGSIEKDSRLTERETEILIMTCEGKTMKQIAAQLSISIKTIDFHKGNIYKKLHVSTVAGLYNYAVKHHLISEMEE